MRKKQQASGRVLVCYNCKFKKTLKNEPAAILIIRNHNEGRDGYDRHMMRVLGADELQSANSLPFYDGYVYRKVCDCNTILDRKSQAGVEYAAAMHMLTGEETNRYRAERHESILEHNFDDREEVTIETEYGGRHTEMKTKPRLMKIPRGEYIAKKGSEEVQLKEHMARYNIKPEQLTKETAITTFDPDIFWLSTRSFSFNWLNHKIFQSLRLYNCPQCGEHSWHQLRHEKQRLWPIAKDLDGVKQFETFKELYWHYYREHYIEIGSKEWEGEKLQYLSTKHSELIIDRVKVERWRCNDREARERQERALKNIDFHIDESGKELEALSMATKSGIKIHDTALSMLQQMVLVEIAIGRRAAGRNSFKYDRASNALYQLNRIHGISLDDLRALFFARVQGRRHIGERLFHGMVWTENKAPDWLDAVVKTLGDKMEI